VHGPGLSQQAERHAGRQHVPDVMCCPDARHTCHHTLGLTISSKDHAGAPLLLMLRMTTMPRHPCMARMCALSGANGRILTMKPGDASRRSQSDCNMEKGRNTTFKHQASRQAQLIGFAGCHGRTHQQFNMKTHSASDTCLRPHGIHRYSRRSSQLHCALCVPRHWRWEIGVRTPFANPGTGLP
jgi:hypothetical protein